jgi:tetratricopeptide (TPR) repeat protein
MAKLGEMDSRTLKARIVADYKRADVRKEALDLKGGIADCRSAVAFANILAARSDADEAARRLQWSATEKLGDVLFAAGEPEASGIYETATSLARTLSARAEQDAARRRDLALSLAAQGRSALDPNAALGYFDESLATTRELLVLDPANPLYWRDKALALIRVGGDKFQKGERVAGAADLNEALDILRRLYRDDPFNARVKHDVLAALMARAETQLQSEKRLARADFDEAARIAREFIVVDRGSARSRLDLAAVLMKLSLNFHDGRPFADEVRKLVADLDAGGLMTPADRAKMEQFERQMQ